MQSQLCMSLLALANRRGVQHQRLSSTTEALIARIRRAKPRDAENPDHLSVLNRRFLIRPYTQPLHSISDIIQTTATMPQYRPIPQAVSQTTSRDGSRLNFIADLVELRRSQHGVCLGCLKRTVPSADLGSSSTSLDHTSLSLLLLFARLLSIRLLL